MTVPQDPVEAAQARADARERAAEIAERRLADARADARSLAQQNEKLNVTLREARESLLAMRAQLEALSNPPQAHGVVLGVPEPGLADVSVGGRVLRVAVSPDLTEPQLRAGSSVLLNEAMMLVGLGPQPSQFDVVVVPNLYGDIASDLAAGLVGGLGIAPGATIGKEYAVFEAVHGSAPDIAGQNKANPTAEIMSAAMMLDHLGELEIAERIRRGVRAVYADGSVLTGDIRKATGSSAPAASCTEFTEALIAAIKAQA